MFFRVFSCVILLTITAAAQPRGFTPEPAKPSSAVAVSPDGNIVAVARGNTGASRRYGRVELWNARTGELLHTITGFDGPVWSLTFSPDGKTLTTVSTEYRESKIQTKVRDREEKVVGELKWWNTETGEFIKKVSVADEGVVGLEATWSAAGDVIALIERRAEGQLTDISVPGAFGQRTTVARYVSFDETELKLLDAQTGERRIKLEDASTRQRGFLGHLFTRLEHAVFSPDGTKVAVLAGEDVKIWDVRTGKKIRMVKKLDGWPSALAFSGDGQIVAVASVKGRMPGGESEISLWEVATGKSVNKLKGKNDLIAALQFAAGDRALLIGSLQYEQDSATGTVKMWDLRENRLGRFNVHENEAVSSFTLIPNENAVVVQSGSEVEIRDTKTWEVKYAFEPTEVNDNDSMRRSGFLLSAKRALAVSFSADGTTVSAEIPGEGTRVWDVRTGELKERIPREQASDGVLTASSNGGLIVHASAHDEAGQIQVRNAKTESLIRTIEAGQRVTAVAIDLSGELLAVARADYSIGVWDLKTGALQAELKTHQNTVNALAFSPDGHVLASGGDDRTAILWDVQSGRAKRTLKGHDVTVTSLAFSPDGSILASGSGNVAVVLWNVASGKLDRILR
jgi:WD40 repeat protein